MNKLTQLQMYNRAHRQNADMLQHALFSIGKMPGPDGEVCVNPLTRTEVEVLATSGKSYSSSYQQVLRYFEVDCYKNACSP